MENSKVYVVKKSWCILHNVTHCLICYGQYKDTVSRKWLGLKRKRAVHNQSADVTYYVLLELNPLIMLCNHCLLLGFTIKGTKMKICACAYVRLYISPLYTAILGSMTLPNIGQEYGPGYEGGTVLLHGFAIV